jgi:hypothetical protein
MLKSFEGWTGILIHRNYESKINEFDKLLSKYGFEYCKMFDIPYKHNVERKEHDNNLIL